ncbi:MAG: TIGR00282 family metallophosphoesterase [Gammaproteobacteria bacterium]|nr:TIGR00282 family metallophosphoesterase [Gammaproteobacteria bacterium]
MNLLFVGDVVGDAGRRVLLANLANLRARMKIDVVVVNIENAAGGFGVTEKIARECLQQGVDVLSTGNHVFDKREAIDLVGRERRLLRPHNYPPAVPGSGWYVGESAQGEPFAVLNVMGTAFMHPVLDCPFACVERTLTAKPAGVKAILVDFHAETTSEKMAMGWFADGRVSAVVGTHTHVPTADERVLPEGTAYISDVGMTGCYDSVIGMNKEKVLRRMVQKLPERMEAAEGRATLCAVLIDIDARSGRSRNISRLAIRE